MVNEADGRRYAMRAVYVEVVDLERLVWTEADTGMTTTVTFSDLGNDQTEMHIHQTHVPEAVRRPDAQTGFATSLDRFAAYLAALVDTAGRSVGFS